MLLRIKRATQVEWAVCAGRMGVQRSCAVRGCVRIAWVRGVGVWPIGGPSDAQRF